MLGQHMAADGAVEEVLIGFAGRERPLCGPSVVVLRPNLGPLMFRVGLMTEGLVVIQRQ